ncbi:MAG: DUF4270 domain-containing protein [Candidatus Aphodosoma sp.]
MNGQHDTGIPSTGNLPAFVQPAYLKCISLSILFALVGILFSCSGKDPSVDIVVRPPEDAIIVNADTFIVESANYYVPAISAQADTMIVGEFYNAKYGPTKADLIVQLAHPAGYQFPGAEYNPQPDSLVLLMFYNTWFGSAYAPLEFSIFENNISAPDYNTRYMSDFDPGMFTDSSILMGKRLATTIDLSRSDSLTEDTASAPYIRYRFDDEQLQRFWNIPAEAYTSDEAFSEHFKGLYITTRYGSSTLVHFNQITLFLYYHYTYQRSGKDTVVETSVIFPANREVRQLNRFYHHDIATSVVCPDSVCYIKSAAGIYPKIKIPLGRITERIYNAIGNKELNINGAEIDIEAVDFNESESYFEPPSYLLAVTPDEFDELIRTNGAPASVDTTQVMATYSPTSRKYTLDLNYLLTKHLRQPDIQPDDIIELMLVPIHVEQNSSGKAISVKPQTKLSAVTVRSGRNSHSPMRLKILYNGF